ncbi:hypothetical protein T12_3006 [Trichinella patagoniensis]|uniref:Uncharacterized protein n=1 Tax=Trichinella patagoniensis TaxID=990121 RepID=A0A0V0ZFK4_9BILA|nr:hypothetical protein T12_3006 [Trichinella patagoniensis]
MYGSIFTILITRRANTPGSVGGPSGSLGTKLRPERVIFVHLAGDLSTPNDHYSIWHTDSKNVMRVGRHSFFSVGVISSPDHHEHQF